MIVNFPPGGVTDSLAGVWRGTWPAVAVAGVVLAMAAVLFFVGLGSLGLTDRDEGRNAEAGRETAEDVGGEVYAEVHT